MDKITLVTAPDDITNDGFRILCVDLNQDQNQIVSDTLNTIESTMECIVYVWTSGEPEQWLFDKKQKSNLIIFNGASHNGEVVGYLSAQPNSVYFGPLKMLAGINNRDIYDVDVCKNFLIHHLRKHEKTFQ
jgi:hypothetical protein